MFQKTDKNNQTESVSINLIGNGTTIVGEIKSNGDVRIDGILNGNINISGKLVVGPTGKIEGNVTSQNADISGFIKGKIIIKEILTLKASANIVGDIITSKISIEPNASFTGTCNMESSAKNVNHINEIRQPNTKAA